MECDPTDDRPVVVEISSDEGSPPMVGSNEDFDWLGELLCEDALEGLAAEEVEEEDDVVVIGEFSPLDKLRKRKLKGCDDRNAVDDDECLVLDGDPNKLAAVEGDKGNDGGSDSDDLLIIGEKGQVACRDYPHPRHDCVKFPFNTTSHEKHCNMCHCYVCDSLAPCIYWGKGMSNSDHCHATDKDGDWKIRRKDLKLGLSAGQNTFSIDNGTAQIVVPLPAQTLHLGKMSSAANMTPKNLVSQQMTAHHAGQTIIPGSTPIPTNLTQHNLVPRQAIYCPRSKISLYGNTTSPANSSLARQQILQRCSSSVTHRSSNHICSGARKQQSGNLKIGLQPRYAPGRLSNAINIVRPDGHHVRSNIRPQHTSSVPRFKKTGIVYRPSASKARYVSNNPSRAPQVQRSSKFSEYTAVNAGLNEILRQNGLLCTDFPSDVRSGLLNATSTLPNMGHPQSSVFCRSSGGMSTDLQNVSPIYQQIEDARPLNQSDHAHHQNQGGPLHHEAVTMDSAAAALRHRPPIQQSNHEAVTMDSAAAAPRHQPPIQQSNHHLPQEFDLGSSAMNDNWWSKNELPQGQIPLEPPPAAVDIGMLLFDFETSWDGVTR